MYFLHSSFAHGAHPNARSCATRLGEATAKPPTMVSAPFLARRMRDLERFSWFLWLIESKGSNSVARTFMEARVFWSFLRGAGQAVRSMLGLWISWPGPLLAEILTRAGLTGPWEERLHYPEPRCGSMWCLTACSNPMPGVQQIDRHG